MIARYKVHAGHGPTDDELLRLRDAADAAGVTVQQLQYYMMVGVVKPTKLSGGRQRLFDADAVKRIRMVRLLNASGYTLRDIREIFMSGR